LSCKTRYFFSHAFSSFNHLRLDIAKNAEKFDTDHACNRRSSLGLASSQEGRVEIFECIGGGGFRAFIEKEILGFRIGDLLGRAYDIENLGFCLPAP
jgi:hypothetical protein